MTDSIYHNKTNISRIYNTSFSSDIIPCIISLNGIKLDLLKDPRTCEPEPIETSQQLLIIDFLTAFNRLAGDTGALLKYNN
jgi:hypothetical protein